MPSPNANDGAIPKRRFSATSRPATSFRSPIRFKPERGARAELGNGSLMSSVHPPRQIGAELQARREMNRFRPGVLLA